MMQKINSISTATILLMGAKSPGLVLLAGIILLRIQRWVNSLHKFYSYVIQPVLYLLFSARRNCKNASVAIVPTPKSCTAENWLLSGEAEMVMEKLGFYCDPRGDKFEERIRYEDIVNLFIENEPSLEEVKEAFDVFDKNKDGYIDAKELEEVLCRLGLTQFGERDCQRMITTFDDNGDSLVDFSEFLKLADKSF
ncbi:hypothetical protein LguiB_007907 [Lonicera macranthoides]